MSDDRKEPSAPGLGLRSFILANKARSEQLTHPSKWAPGAEVLSAEEYDRFTEQLARELLATYTPEHIAVIAAQHMMYADELKLCAHELGCMLKENMNTPDKIIEIARELTSKIATEVAMTAYKARRKHDDMKRANGVKKTKAPVKDLAISMAAERWRKDTEEKIKTGKMAEAVYEDLLKTEHRKLVSSQGAVHRWIAPIAPEYAKKPGP